MSRISVFGEVLYDCFPDGQRILGGAPFNVSWHLQHFGDAPRFISSVGADDMGQEIMRRMREAGMRMDSLQQDADHGTGVVEVEFQDHEPVYRIREDVAWDHIGPAAIPTAPLEGILYHGSLALRHRDSRDTLWALLEANPRLSVFLDVNLRPPWWNQSLLDAVLGRARWCKLNAAEIAELGFPLERDPVPAMSAFHERHQLELLILTRGADGALVLDHNGQVHRQPPARQANPVDSVGAGDAFSAVFVHGLLRDWPTSRILQQAQDFAAAIVGIRGATPATPDFYQPYQPEDDSQHHV